MRDQRMKMVGCLLGVLLCMSLQTALAAPIQLVDNASNLSVDPTSQAGMFQWNVSGVNQLAQQWFWYRVGNAGPESSVDTLGVPFVGLTDSNFDGQMDTLYLRYTSNQLQAELTFTLRGAAPGVARSDIAETIKLTNLTAAPMDLHLFEYCNLDLAGTAQDQSVAIVGGKDRKSVV
jgi:large repetitive protein